jgi:putative transcriptional regulator
MANNQSLVGHFLVATPDLVDPNFNQSVILMVHHDETGASGLILNRASNTTIGEIFELEPPLQTGARSIYVGGPVNGPIMAIHQCVSLGERDLIDQVYFSMGRENIVGIISQTLRPFRLFCGYSGWGKNQLEAEIEAGGWLVAAATQELLFSDENALWRTVSDQVGLSIILAERAGRQHCPPDPSLN